MLPGAIQAPPATAPKTPPGPASKKLKPLGLKAPSEETVLGRELSLDGAAGVIVLEALPGSGIAVSKLSLAGESLSHPPDECRVDVVGNGPIAASFAGRPKGVTRYQIEVAACPFSLDVLEGAVLVTRPAGTCDFAAAECRVNPAGLWGPAGGAIGPDQAKRIERERSRAESNMRANFRALLASVGKDREAIKRIAGEQAGFSSEREITCRKYQKEEEHGFCALRITQARALALEAAFADIARTHPGAKAAQAMPQKKRAARNPSASLKVNATTSPGPVPGLSPQPDAMPAQ
jgi:hypothetical protein